MAVRKIDDGNMKCGQCQLEIAKYAYAEGRRNLAYEQSEAIKKCGSQQFVSVTPPENPCDNCDFKRSNICHGVCKDQVKYAAIMEWLESYPQGLFTLKENK